MNKNIFKLVFDASRGMRVPAAETARGQGKRKASGEGLSRSACRLANADFFRGGLCALAVLTASSAMAARPLPSSATIAPRHNLPQAAANFNQLGRATQALDPANARRLVVEQTDKRVILNWTSFDIGSGYGVLFNQPTGGSALNRIGSSDPSVIMGSLEANGEVILYNANGVLFGKGATVNTGNFVATTLNIADDQFEKGFRNITRYTPAFAAAADGGIEGFIRVEAGASIRTAEGGDIMLFAPRVRNEGRLAAPGGQVMLAAGQKVYLAASTDSAARGFLVEVDPFATGDTDYNTVENAARGSTAVTLDSEGLVTRVNEIVAERGTINMVGLSVRQMGVARATTAVKGENGAIYLLAHGGTKSTSHANGISGDTMAVASSLGTLVVGPESVTRVDPDASNTTQTDAETFNDSTIRLEGKNIHLQGGAQLAAAGAGSQTATDATYADKISTGVSILATAGDPAASGAFRGSGSTADDNSRIVIDSGVTIDVSGADVDLEMSRNVLTGQLFSIQLADMPLQRGGVLYRSTISFDRRKGTGVADVSDFYGLIGRTAAEKLSAGGRITIVADGAAVVDKGATLDVSGGALRYAGGEIRTTLLRSRNRRISISDASPDVVYDEVITPEKGHYESAYVEGKDAGELIVAGRQVSLDATLRGTTTVGRYQRGGAAGERPRAARLQAGIEAGSSTAPDYYVRNLVLNQFGAAALGADFFADPFNAGLGERGTTTTLSAAAIAAGGFGQVVLFANDLLRVDADTALNLGAGGFFAATARRTEVNGTIVSPAGDIALTARPTTLTGSVPAPDAGVSVVIGSGAQLSTAGLWTNDTGRHSDTSATVATDGGGIRLAAYGDVSLQAGSMLDVSAGAWRNASGKTAYGDAGSIVLTANSDNGDAQQQQGKVTLGGTLSGYGFGGGGSLTLTTLDLTVSGQASAGLWLTPGFFSDLGFENITLNSIRDLTIADNTAIDARLRTRALDTDAATRVSGSAISDISHFASDREVDAVARQAVNLAFNATRLPSASAAIQGASLTVGQGATVATEAGGRLSFSAGQNLTVAGTLSAPGGAITLKLNGARGGNNADSPDDIGFLPTQAIWLTETAKLEAGGTVEYANTRAGLQSGTIYGGGTVTLAAQRGYIVAESGSTIDIGGYETQLDQYGQPTRTLMSRDAGRLSLSSPEGIFVASTIDAHAPGARAEGGALQVEISRQGTNNYTAGMAYPTGERKIVLSAAGNTLPDGLLPGDDLQAALGNGVASVSAQAIGNAGFADVKLRADDRIEFAGNVALNAARSLELNTRTIAGQDSAVATLTAPHVAMGDIDIEQITGMAPVTASNGTGSFAVTADLIDVVGKVGLQGFASTTLNATRGGRRDGEIRLRGRALPGQTALTGALLFAGRLDLTAGQIYPTTFSEFKISGLAGNSTLRTFAPDEGSTSALPLSAFGSLTLEADTIEHGGVLRAPFGNLTLDAADKLTLAADSELSVSGDGLTVPVGITVNGSTWYYYPRGEENGEVRGIGELPVSKHVSLKAGTLDLSPEARVSAAGGGAVQASEWISGAGGLKDYLADTPGLYAVLPGYAFGYAPYDAQIEANGTNGLKAGDQLVITMAGSTLAPGTYTLLPAAYGLLPGAALVSLAADQGSATLKSALQLTDGSAIVTGYRSAASTALTGDANQRYLIEPASTFLKKSEYLLTNASGFFAKRAASLGDAVGSRPIDAGRISLRATQLLDWRALFDLSAPAGARGGEFDLATPNLVLLKDGQTPSAGHGMVDGYTVVSTESLAATGAASILLGGTRSGSGTAANVTTVSDAVRVEADVTGNEMLFAAKDNLTVADGVAITATGDASDTAGQLSLSGDGAFLRVSNNTGIDIVRTGVARTTGDLLVGKDVKLTGRQVDIDATGALALDNTAALSADSFSLGAGRIAFGGASPEGDGVIIGGTLLDTLGGASSLALRSYSTIDFLANLDLALVGDGRLVLDAAGLRGFGGTVNLSAAEVLLRNSSGGTLAANGSGTLNIEAHPPLRDGTTGGMEIGGGSQSLGFDKVTLKSLGDLVFSGTGAIAAQGDLDLVAERVTAATAADQKARAAGVLTVSRPTGGHTLGERIGLGAKLALAGERVVQNGTIDLSGGQLTIDATNAAGAQYAIEFGNNSVTRAGGFSTASGSDTVHGDAGSIAVTAAKGAIKVDGAIDVAALAGGGNGGTLTFAATGSGGTLELGSAATLSGAAGADGAGGSFGADLESLPAAAAGLIDGLATATGSFTHAFDLRVRTGDVELKTATVKAENVSIAADAGSLTVTGTVDARAEQGGVVRLAAGGDMTLGPGGRILASSSRAGANGGDVLLASKAGTVKVAADSTIDAGGDDEKDGRVVLRAAQNGNAVKIAPVKGSIKAGEIAIEAVKTYAGYTSLGTGTTSGAKLGQTTVGNDLSGFMQNKGAILAALGVSSDPRFHLRSGVQIEASGDFAVANDWNLYSFRYGGEAGFLTIRAAGNLNINGTISDGFSSTARVSTIQSGDAWSMRLVAGADLAAANPLATIVSDSKGDLTLAKDKLLRTTSGSIELAAGRDIVLAGTTAAPATIMVTGTVSATPDELVDVFTNPTEATFSTKGGRISAAAGRDIKSPASDQLLISNWFDRYYGEIVKDLDGDTDGDGNPIESTDPWYDTLAWWNRYDLFRHGFGSFGGGNIALRAGRDIQDVSAMAPTTGRQADGAELFVENGGDVEVWAGRDIAGGSYFVGRGDGMLKAGGVITTGTAPAANVGRLAPILALIDGSWTLRSRGGVALTGIFNPTAFNVKEAAFYTYGQDASLDIATTTGDFSWLKISQTALQNLGRLPPDTPTNLKQDITLIDADAKAVFYVAPPELSVVAHTGNLTLGANSANYGITLYPSATGNLALYAGGDINLDTHLRLIDNYPTSLPSVERPTSGNVIGYTTWLGLKHITYEINRLVLTDLHDGDKTPVRIHAEGSINVTDGMKIFSPKATEISAGKDIVNLTFYGQHHAAGDVTRILAGRNFVNNTIPSKNQQGQYLDTNRGLISLAGPGTLEIEAGRQIDLGKSAGVETVGNRYNATLPEGGASVSMAAGLDPTLDGAAFAAFLGNYLKDGGAPSGANYRDDLVAYVRQTLNLGTVALDYDAALALLGGMSDAAKIEFARVVLAEEFGRTYLASGKAYAALWSSAAAAAGVAVEDFAGDVFERVRDQVVFEELKQAGIAGSAAKGAKAKEAGYAPGYAALELAGYGAPFAYFGNLDLIESKVQTKSGGDIEFRVPGGNVNVGLSSDASAKSAANRGVVAFAGGNIRSFTDRDFLVNAQKVFVVGAGDILLWSSNGDIDSGRGSNSTISVPPPVAKITDDGIVFESPAVTTGSGIGILDAGDSKADGAAYLFAPRGEVIALDAYIRAPVVYFDPEKIRGADNVIGVSANPVSAPVVASVGGLANAASNPAAANTASTAAPTAGTQEKNSILTVEVLASESGTSAEDAADKPCAADDEQCKRERSEKPKRL